MMGHLERRTGRCLINKYDSYVSMQIGIDLYKKHKGDLTKLTVEELEAVIIENRDKLGFIDGINGKQRMIYCE
ncbi:hypothetical protein [Mechercharimyces sp. CAU 1602]|uniref:hypothetical protein n=1 Tax=Mechercharimyces sp. CAU 1602 TaxID=2973933 RepID=UPI002162F622|nr:hypothetical protein [Mechercharimyces sp. CAU 1602]MCS1352412.1 hypothetical protein [Mechercharimyces sp. CAU 1602]